MPRRAPIEIDGIDIGQQQESIGRDFLGEEGGGAVLVDNGLNADEASVSTANDGYPAAAGANYDHSGLEQQSDQIDVRYVTRWRRRPLSMS